MPGQYLLRLTRFGADRRLRQRRIRSERRMACGEGLKVPVRVMSPAGTPRGLVLDIHDGGWVIGNPEMNDARNAAIVGARGLAVVSVEHRLAPHTAPAPGGSYRTARLAGNAHGIIHFPTAMARAVYAHAHAWIRERLGQAPKSPALPAPAGA